MFNPRLFGIDDPLRLQQEVWRTLQGRRGVGVFPAVNVFESDDDFTLSAELPGVDKGSLELSVKGDQLSLKGERVASGEKGSYHRREREVGTFERTITLPEAVDAEHVSAVWAHGVLQVRLPRMPASKPQKIDIH